MNVDKIEQTQEFIDALKKIQPALDSLSEELSNNGWALGACHIYWSKKKELLKNEGIDWKTPAECNPHTIFD